MRLRQIRGSVLGKRSGYLRNALALVALLASANAALAQTFNRSISNLTDAIQNTLDLRPSDVTNMRLGLGPGITPAFEGSREYRVNPVPLISLRYRDVLKVDNNEIDFTAFDQVFDFDIDKDGVAERFS